VLLFIVFVLNLYSKELVALLKGVESNHILHMSYKQSPFVCKPYGIESVSQLLERTDVNSSCKEYLNEFRREHPQEKFFAQMHLHIQQQYSVKGLGDLCLLHLSSGSSYSEALLEEGYARIPIGITYESFILNHRFQRALLRAKSAKTGMWSDVNVINCFLLPPKEN